MYNTGVPEERKRVCTVTTRTGYWKLENFIKEGLNTYGPRNKSDSRVNRKRLVETLHPKHGTVREP